ncbi:MAG: K(+)-transporting ATPase subunit C [Parabacteroides sp.]
MNNNLIKSIRLTFFLCVVLIVCYVFVLWLFARVAGPNKGNADLEILNGQVVGVANAGQLFGGQTYFWGRPSCAGNGYDASNSGGSNKGPGDKAYLEVVQQRLAYFLKNHPYLTRKDVPAEMVTASGSGLDPHISPRSAYIQVRRIAGARHCSEQTVKMIVDRCIEKPWLGLFGPAKVNVLKMNVALDEATDK